MRIPFNTSNDIPHRAFERSRLEQLLLHVQARAAAVVLIITLSACADQVTESAPLASVTVTAGSNTLFSAGDTVRLSAVARDARGKVISGRPFTWTTSDVSVVTVSASGLATATGPNGSATITATTEGVSGTAMIAVATGSRGGTVIAAGGQVTLRVPAGAVSSALTITVNPVTTFPIPERVVPGAVFDFGPNGTQFVNSVQLSIRYDTRNVPAGVAEGALRLYQLRGDAWFEVLGSTIDVPARTVSGLINSFSTYGVAAAAEATLTTRTSIETVSSTQAPVRYPFRGVIWNIYLGEAKSTIPVGNRLGITIACAWPDAHCTPNGADRIFLGHYGLGWTTNDAYAINEAYRDPSCSGGQVFPLTGATTLAHELGHAVQEMTGKPRPTTKEESEHAERQAQCLGWQIINCGLLNRGTTISHDVVIAALDCVLSRGYFDPTFVQIATSARHSASRQASSIQKAQLNGRIVFPAEASLIRAEIPIFGLAFGPDFDSYTVEYGRGKAPERWQPLAHSGQPEHAARGLPELYTSSDYTIRGNLATWDVGLTDYVYLPTYPRDHPVDLKGTYTIRLTVNGKDGSTVEDRVTVLVGNLISYAWGGVATSSDDMARLAVPEHALTQPFRLIGFEAVAEAPRVPVNQRVIGSAYIAREPGESFTTAAELTMRLPEALAPGVGIERLSIYGYNAEREHWEKLPTVIRLSDDVLLTRLRRLHAYYAIMEGSNATPAVPETSMEQPVPVAKQSADQQSYLIRQDFETDVGTWRNRGGDNGAIVELDRSGAGRSALQLVNATLGSSFGVTVHDQPFDASIYPVVEFDYRIGPEVRTDVYAKVSGRWYNIGFTDDPNEFRNKRVNIAPIGRIDSVRADGEWHTARFNLWDMLRSQTRERIVEQIVMADWDVGGMMRLGFGHNAEGATYWIDDFAIRSDDSPRLRRADDVILIDDFRGPDDRNLLGEPTQLFTDGIGGAIHWTLEDDSILGRALKLAYNVAGVGLYAGLYAGYVSHLPGLDLRDHQLLRFNIRGSDELHAVLIGVRDGHGNESKVRLGDFATAAPADHAVGVTVPLIAFAPTIDWSNIVQLTLSMASPTASRGQVVIDDLRFEKALDSVVIDRFDATDVKNLLGGEHAAFMNGEGVASAVVVDEDGNRALRIVYGGAIPWSHAGWRTDLRGLDCSRCDAIRLRIRGAQGGEKPNLYLDDGNHRWPVDVEKYGIITTEWREIAIPLADLAAEGIDLTHLAALELVFEWEKMSGALFVDDIRFGPRTIATR